MTICNCTLAGTHACDTCPNGPSQGRTTFWNSLDTRQKGWICTVCNTVNAPWAPKCTSCPKPVDKEPEKETFKNPEKEAPKKSDPCIWTQDRAGLIRTSCGCSESKINYSWRMCPHCGKFLELKFEQKMEAFFPC